MNTACIDETWISDASREELIVLVGELQGQIAQLLARIIELEDRLAKDSHNSSKPPSSDISRGKPAPKSLRGRSGKASGGQPGHSGHTLCLSDAPDEIIYHSPDFCACCGALLLDVPVLGYDRHQVFDLPPVHVQVTEHRALFRVCPCCRMENRGQFPTCAAKPVQYGERVKAALVYLSCYQMLPWERAAGLVGDLFGCSVSEGVLCGALSECSNRLRPVMEGVKAALSEADIAHFDETGQRVAGKRWWLHVASTESLTYYRTHPKRGCEATDDIGILPVFSGRAIHDSWNPYFRYSCRHGLCNSHHLRELTFLLEEHKQKWAGKMKTLLLDIKGCVEEAKTEGGTGLDRQTLLDFNSRYDQLIDEGYLANPEAKRTDTKRGCVKQSKGRNLADRLSENKEQTLAFMHDFAVPFDNNLAERDIRMMKVHDKISGCFRTEEGARVFDCIRGYISTMRKQGHGPLQVLQTAFSGQPAQPAFA